MRRFDQLLAGYAEEVGLDLVEVAPGARPSMSPSC